MTSINQKRTFQIYVNGTTQASNPITYNTKLESGLYKVKLLDVSLDTTTTTTVIHELRSGFLVNSLGNIPYYTFIQQPDTAVPVYPKLFEYQFGEIYLSQYIDLWIVNKLTGAPDSGLLYAVITFEVEKVA
jgi:hypothetical protein